MGGDRFAEGQEPDSGLAGLFVLLVEFLEDFLRGLRRTERLLSSDPLGESRIQTEEFRLPKIPTQVQLMKTRRRYTVSDGKTVLTLEVAEEGGYVVTSPLDPELITEAETVEAAFDNARDAAKALKQSRGKLFKKRPAAVATRGA